jgi:hypothetical protein
VGTIGFGTFSTCPNFEPKQRPVSKSGQSPGHALSFSFRRLPAAIPGALRELRADAIRGNPVDLVELHHDPR